MRKRRQIVFLFLLMAMVFCTSKRNVSTVNASPDIYQGDLVLTGNNVTVIEDIRFDINGSIIIEDNATLILKNAVVNITQPIMGPYNITLRNPSNGNPRLIVSNASLESNYGFKICFYGNSTVSADELRAYKYMYFYDNSSAVIVNSGPILFLNSYQFSSVQIFGSEFVQMRCHDSSVVSILDSTVPNFVEVYSKCNTLISNSTVRNLGNYGSSITEVSDCGITNTYFQGGPSSTLALINSSIEQFRAWGGGKISLSDCTTESFVVYGSHDVSLSNCQNLGWMNASGSSIITISDRLVANGTILVEENATLVLENAELNFAQTEDWQYNIITENPAFGNPKLQVANTTIVSNYKYSMKLYGNSSAAIHNSQFATLGAAYCWLWTFDSVEATIHNLTVHGLSSMSSSGVSIFDSSIADLNIYGTCIANVHRTIISTANSYTNANMVTNESTITTVQAFGSSQCKLHHSTINGLHGYENSTVHLVNSTYTNTDVYNQSKVFVCWYLNVHVLDSIGQDVPLADVTAAYLNTTTAESKQTGTNGWTTLTLIEEMINATGNYPLGNYTVEATYDIHSDDATVNMRENRQITLTLEDFIIPESPSLLILPIFIIITLLAVIAYRRKHSVWKLSAI